MVFVILSLKKYNVCSSQVHDLLVQCRAVSLITMSCMHHTWIQQTLPLQQSSLLLQGWRFLLWPSFSPLYLLINLLASRAQLAHVVARIWHGWVATLQAGTHYRSSQTAVGTHQKGHQKILSCSCCAPADQTSLSWPITVPMLHVCDPHGHVGQGSWV